MKTHTFYHLHIFPERYNFYTYTVKWYFSWLFFFSINF